MAGGVFITDAILFKAAYEIVTLILSNRCMCHLLNDMDSFLHTHRSPESLGSNLVRVPKNQPLFSRYVASENS